MNMLKETLKDLEKAAKADNFDYLVTRFNKRATKIDDLDVLVKEGYFEKVVSGFNKLGYKAYSHDQALGGRIFGAQVNLVKKNRVKVDLHKDFTWRAHRYLDLDLVWENKHLVDEFLVFINVIFEKTYIDQEDYDYIWQHKEKVFQKGEFEQQAKKHGWHRSFLNFKNWQPKSLSKPIFLPVYLVLISYIEKFHLISFLYYVFFRVRYLLTKTLPYD